MRRKGLWITAGVAGATAAGWALYRALHPTEARMPDGFDPHTPRPVVADHLLELPEDVASHEIPSRDGGTIHYLEAGTGQPLVLLHGVTLRSDVWAAQFHQLTDRFRVIPVDLRGHGGSTPGADGFGLDRLADDLATLLEALDLRDAIVAGHSMGGMVLMTFCREHPDVLDERVAGVVFVATRASHVVPTVAAAGFRSLLSRGRRVLDAGGELPAGRQMDAGLVRLAFGDRPNPRAIRAVAEMGAAMEPRWLIESVDQMFAHDAREGLRAVRVPSMVLVGTRDLLTPVPSSRALAALLPDSDFVLLRRAGHQLMQERPDELDALLRAFADRLAGSTDDLAAAVDDRSAPGIDDGAVEIETDPGPVD